MAYNAALDAQQRLLVMRGQLEKLQNDQTNLQRWVSLLERVSTSLSEGIKPGGSGPGRSTGSAILEMVVDAQEAERKRLSQLMHDGPAQALSNFIVQTEIAARLLDIDATRAKDELNNLKNAAMSTFQDVRTFIFEIRPMMLDDLGLFPTIRRYIDNYKEQVNAEINLTMKGAERRLQPYLEVMIFRGLQELIGNAVKHNADTPGKVQVTVQVMVDDSNIRVTVSDNGKGFDPSLASKEGRIGLKLIRERAEMLGGSLEIDSTIGKGSKITFQVPCLEA
jgi:two-component system sensor histidine kinase DegS